MAKIELLGHPKWARVCCDLGNIPEVYLLGHFERLLHSTYAQNKPDFCDSDGVEFASRWIGEGGAWASTLIRRGFVDVVLFEGKEVLRVHDWIDHVPQSILRRLAVHKWAKRAGVLLPRSSFRKQDEFEAVASHIKEMASQNGYMAATGYPKRENGSSRTTDLYLYPDLDPSLYSSEPSQEDPEPEPVLTYPTVGDQKTWNLTKDKLNEYQELYPDLDVLFQLKKARQWVIDNPAKKKTAKGMTRYLNSWLDRAQNKGEGKQTHATGKTYR